MHDPAIELGYLIADLRRVYTRVFDRAAATHGLTHVQWRVLKQLQGSEGLTQAALAEALVMEPIAVGRVVDRLQKAGFVQRRADPGDRRCWRLHLDPASTPVIEAVDAMARQLRASFVDGTDRNDLAQVVRVLGQLHDNLSRLDQSQRG